MKNSIVVILLFTLSFVQAQNFRGLDKSPMDKATFPAPGTIDARRIKELNFVCFKHGFKTRNRKFRKITKWKLHSLIVFIKLKIEVQVTVMLLTQFSTK